MSESILFCLYFLVWHENLSPCFPQPPRSLIRWMAQFLLLTLIIDTYLNPLQGRYHLKAECWSLWKVHCITPSSDFANKFIQQESSNPRVPLFKEEPTSPPKPSHITAKKRLAAAVKTEPCDRTERKFGGLVGEKIKEEKLEMTDMDTGMEGKKDRISSSDH